MTKVPVVNSQQNPLMPTNPWKAERLIRSGKATPFWKMGIFCIRLNYETPKNVQSIVVGIDPGSKREAFTIKSCSSTYLNIQTNAIIGIKNKILSRKFARRCRRFRKTPYRICRRNRKRSDNWIPPSIKARWDFKINLVKKLKKIYPITNIIIEDVKAKSHKEEKNWNKSFSPLQTGKNYAYKQFRELGSFTLIYGFDTAKFRDKYGLTKIYEKLSDKFEAHCVDSWCIANSIYEGKLDNKEILRAIPIMFYKRQLHVFNFVKGGRRKNFGGTRSLGFKRGSFIKHPKYGIAIIGGTRCGKLTLWCPKTKKRLTKVAKPEDCKFLSYNNMWFINETNNKVGEMD